MINNYFIQISDCSEKISDPLNHFFIALMFIFIIFSIIGVIFFAKWLTLGPKVKSKFSSIFGKNKNSFEKNGIKIKGKEVIIDENYISEINEKIKNANTPQELLEYQILLEEHKKQTDDIRKKIKEKEDQKLDKLEQKRKNKELSKNAKEEAKMLKKEYKDKKIEEKKIKEK